MGDSIPLIEQLEDVLRTHALSAMAVYEQGIHQTQESLQACLQELHSIQAAADAQCQCQVQRVQEEYQQQLEHLTAQFEEQVKLLEQVTKERISGLHAEAEDVVKQAAAELLSSLQPTGPSSLASTQELSMLQLQHDSTEHSWRGAEVSLQQEQVDSQCEGQDTNSDGVGPELSRMPSSIAVAATSMGSSPLPYYTAADSTYQQLPQQQQLHGQLWLQLQQRQQQREERTLGIAQQVQVLLQRIQQEQDTQAHHQQEAHWDQHPKPGDLSTALSTPPEGHQGQQQTSRRKSNSHGGHSSDGGRPINSSRGNTEASSICIAANPPMQRCGRSEPECTEPGHGPVNHLRGSRQQHSPATSTSTRDVLQQQQEQLQAGLQQLLTPAESSRHKPVSARYSTVSHSLPGSRRTSKSSNIISDAQYARRAAAAAEAGLQSRMTERTLCAASPCLQPRQKQPSTLLRTLSASDVLRDTTRSRQELASGLMQGLRRAAQEAEHSSAKAAHLGSGNKDHAHHSGDDAGRDDTRRVRSSSSGKKVLRSTGSLSYTHRVACQLLDSCTLGLSSTQDQAAGSAWMASSRKASRNARGCLQQWHPSSALDLLQDSDSGTDA